MKKFQMFRYIGKLLPAILIFCILATYGIYFRLKSSNTYVASEVIHYNDEQAEKGLAPTGETLDVNEIKSSVVMSKVVERMGLTGIYSVDSLISRINITPVPDPDKVAAKEAKLEEGEEYVYKPSTYIVSFKAGSGEGADFARTILDETLDVYYSEYSQKYVNIATVNNTIENLEDSNYDYIEMMEMIDTAIDETLRTLYRRTEKDRYYRATGTGASFGDLADEFNYIRRVGVSDLFSRIYKYQITKSKPILISDYTTRIDNNNILNAKEEGIINDIIAVIDEYVNKMRESGNTNITYEYILDNLHERNLTDSEGNPIAAGDQTVTYDELIYSWRDHSETREYAIIDSAYSRYIIDTFGKCTGECSAGECTQSPKTCTELTGRVAKQAPVMLIANHAEVAFTDGEDELPADIVEKFLADGRVKKQLESLIPYSVSFDLGGYAAGFLCFDGAPDIEANGEKTVRIHFVNNANVYGNIPYFLNLRWLTPEGFTVDGGKRSVYLPAFDSHQNGACDVEFTVKAGERVEPVNRIVLEVTAEGRASAAYVPVVLLG